MKVITLVSLALFSSPALAYGTSCTSNQYGSHTYTNCTDGTSETRSKYGSHEYINGNNYRTGESYSGTASQYGNQKYEYRNNYGTNSKDNNSYGSGWNRNSYGSEKKNQWGW